MFASFSSFLVVRTQGELLATVPSRSLLRSVLLPESLALPIDRWPLLFILSWWDTAPFTHNQRCQPLLLSLCDFGRGLTRCTCSSHIHTIIAQGKGWALVWACTRFPLSSSELCSGSLLSPARRRPRPRGQAQEASQEARLLDSWLSWTLARHFLPSPKKPSCGLSLGATRTLPGVLACFFSSLAGHLPANLHIVRASAQRATSAAVSSS